MNRFVSKPHGNRTGTALEPALEPSLPLIEMSFHRVEMNQITSLAILYTDAFINSSIQVP